jgi:hypothetical protein
MAAPTNTDRSKIKRPRRLPSTPCSDFLREQVTLLNDAGWIAHAKEFERAITALRVIHTWAAFDGGRCLDPKDVANLTRKALKGFISSNPNADVVAPPPQDSAST